MRKRVTGLPSGAVDLDKQEVQFTLALGLDRPIDCVAKAGVVEQIISALARACAELRDHALANNLRRSTAAETVTGVMVQREKLHDVVMLQLINDRGVPYTFALSREIAGDIAGRLQTETQRDVPTGSA